MGWCSILTLNTGKHKREVGTGIPDLCSWAGVRVVVFMEVHEKLSE